MKVGRLLDFKNKPIIFKFTQIPLQVRIAKQDGVVLFKKNLIKIDKSILIPLGGSR